MVMQICNPSTSETGRSGVHGQLCYIKDIIPVTLSHALHSKGWNSHSVPSNSGTLITWWKITHEVCRISPMGFRSGRFGCLWESPLSVPFLSSAATVLVLLWFCLLLSCPYSSWWSTLCICCLYLTVRYWRKQRFFFLGSCGLKN